MFSRDNSSKVNKTNIQSTVWRCSWRRASNSEITVKIVTVPTEKGGVGYYCFGNSKCRRDHRRLIL